MHSEYSCHKVMKYSMIDYSSIDLSFFCKYLLSFSARGLCVQETHNNKKFSSGKVSNFEPSPAGSDWLIAGFPPPDWLAWPGYYPH